MKQPDVFLFDIDGTLLNTEVFILKAYEYTLSSIGSKAYDNKELMKTLMGRPLEECYHTLAPDHDFKHLAQIHNTWQASNIQMVQPYPSVHSLMQELHKKKKKIAAVTNRTRLSTLHLLKVTELDTYMQAVVAFDDVTKGKPDPEGINKALAELDESPVNAVMVGDSEFDIIAGRNAGTRTVGVTTGFHVDALKASKPDYIYDDIGEVLLLLT